MVSVRQRSHTSACAVPCNHAGWDDRYLSAGQSNCKGQGSVGKMQSSGLYVIISSVAVLLLCKNRGYTPILCA